MAQYFDSAKTADIKRDAAAATADIPPVTGHKSTSDKEAVPTPAEARQAAATRLSHDIQGLSSVELKLVTDAMHRDSDAPFAKIEKDEKSGQILALTFRANNRDVTVEAESGKIFDVAAAASKTEQAMQTAMTAMDTANVPAFSAAKKTFEDSMSDYKYTEKRLIAKALSAYGRVDPLGTFQSDSDASGNPVNLLFRAKGDLGAYWRPSLAFDLTNGKLFNPDFEAQVIAGEFDSKGQIQSRDLVAYSLTKSGQGALVAQNRMINDRLRGNGYVEGVIGPSGKIEAERFMVRGTETIFTINPER